MSEMKDRIEDVLELGPQIIADGKITLPEAAAYVFEVIETAAEIVKTLEDRQGQFETLVKDCEAWFDEHIAPLDLRGVPNWLEKRFLDPLLRSTIRPAIAAIYDAIEGDQKP